MSLLCALSACLKQYTALLAAIGGWRRKASGHWSEAPFLDVGLDKDESALAEIDVYGTRSISTNCREEVLRFQTMCNIVQLFPISSEKHSASTRSVADTYYITLNIFRTVITRSKRLVVAAVTG